MAGAVRPGTVRRADQAGAAGGILFTVLALASVAVVPAPPAVDDPAADVRAYLLDNAGGLKASTVLMTLATLAFVPFVALVHRRMSDAEPASPLAGTFLVGAVANVTLGLVGVLLQSALVVRIAPVVDDGAARAWYGAWEAIAHSGASLAITVSLVAAAIGLRSVLPRWLGWVALVSAALGLVSSIIDLTSNSTADAPTGLAGFALANVWFVGVSVSVLRSRRPSTTGQAS